MKWVKQRAVTVNRKRAVEMALAEQKEHGENEDGIMQGLYSRNQTELYIPDPIIDVSSFICEILLILTQKYIRGRYQGTISATLIYMFHLCFPKEQHLYLVGFV